MRFIQFKLEFAFICGRVKPLASRMRIICTCEHSGAILKIRSELASHQIELINLKWKANYV